MLPKLLFVAAVVFLLAVLVLPGCFRRAQQPALATPITTTGISGTLQKVGSAPAGEIVSASMQPFFRAGLALMVIGGLVAGFFLRKTGLMLIILGIATTGVGVLFIQYPWVVLAFALLAVVTAGLAVYKLRYVLQALVKLIEKHKELKSEICDGDKAEQEKIRPEVRAVKALLGIPVT